MVKRILFLLFILFPFTLPNQEVDTTPHIHQFMELINREDYVKDHSEFLSLKENNEKLKINKDSFYSDSLVSLMHLGKAYYSLGQYSQAELVYIKFLNMYEAATILEQQENKVYLISSLYSLANILVKQHKYSEAYPIFKELIEECDASEDGYVLFLQNAAEVCSLLKKHREAELYISTAIKTQRELYSDKNTIYAQLLNSSGVIYINQEKYYDASRYFRETLTLVEQLDENLSFDYIETMNNLAYAYYMQGNYIDAEQYYLTALQNQREEHGEVNSLYASILSNLAVLYNDKGDYNKAEKLHIDAFKIKKTLHNKCDSEYIISINNIAGFYSDIFQYEKSYNYYMEAVKLCKACENDSLIKDESNILINLGSLLIDMGFYNEAEEYHMIALNLDSSRLSDVHFLNSLARLYLRMDKYEEAEKCLVLVMRLHKEQGYGNIFSYITTLTNIGAFWHQQNNYVEAESYYKEALSIFPKNYKSMQNYFSLIGNLGIMYLDNGQFYETQIYLLHQRELLKQRFKVSLNYMTEHERLLFWNGLQESFEYSYPKFSYKYNFTNPSISTFAYDNELFRKGLLLNSSEMVRRSILESGDNTLIKQWNELTEAKQVVMHLEEKEPTSSQLEIYRHRADSLEKIVTKSSAVFRENKEQLNINWKSIKKQLSQNEVAIECFSAPLSQDSTMYCALLLRHNSEYPELIPLFEEKEVTEITSTINESIDNNLLYNYNKFGATLSEKVWSKILPRVKEGETIYFSPSGLLHQLAIEFLPVDSVRTMSDVYNMVRLSSTRELALNKKQTSKTRATVYGGISYTLDKETMQTESRRYASQERSIDADTLNRGTAIDLPATLVEAKYIDSLLVANNITTTLFTSEKANEESFKALSGKGNRILHIATHGFTWTDSVARKQDYFASRIQMIGDNLPKGPVIDPLNRCGLLFAGANTAYQGRSKDLPGGVQDGILKAKEISLMDLRGTELVVLSACETAQGDITSEGVFGLQRAFKMAGVQTIIMSLWKVDDKETKMFMSEFYKNWIEKKQSKREAFNNAKNTVRYAVNEFGIYIYKDKPYYWAGFIMLD